MRPEDLDIARSWLDKAHDDERTIEILLQSEDPPWAVVAFHAQQLAEKCLKSLLALRSIPFPRTHDLSVLALRAGEAVGIDPGQPDLVELSQMAVAPRYPEEPEPVEREAAMRAVATARDIAVLVRNVVPC
jgi:HEPN domain-containing protein